MADPAHGREAPRFGRMYSRQTPATG